FGIRCKLLYATAVPVHNKYLSPRQSAFGKGVEGNLPLVSGPLGSVGSIEGIYRHLFHHRLQHHPALSKQLPRSGQDHSSRQSRPSGRRFLARKARMWDGGRDRSGY
ncbi:MAG: hypothetical protein NZ762_02105, partial [Dehalococcoidia bacterium]|nr:hypothetical protein [Dehalococcoidia bacterium]